MLNQFIAPWLTAHAGDCIICTLILWLTIAIIAFTSIVLRRFSLIR